MENSTELSGESLFQLMKERADEVIKGVLDRF